MIFVDFLGGVGAAKVVAGGLAGVAAIIAGGLRFHHHVDGVSFSIGRLKNYIRTVPQVDAAIGSTEIARNNIISEISLTTFTTVPLVAGGFAALYFTAGWAQAQYYNQPVINKDEIVSSRIPYYLGAIQYWSRVVGSVAVAFMTMALFGLLVSAGV